MNEQTGDYGRIVRRALSRRSPAQGLAEVALYAAWMAESGPLTQDLARERIAAELFRACGDRLRATLMAEADDTYAVLLALADGRPTLRGRGW